MGASMGLAGGSLLGELLALNPNDINAALSTWEDRLRPYIRQHQRTSLFNAQIFTPGGPIAYVLREGLMRLSGGEKPADAAPNALSKFFARPRNVEFVA